MTTRHKVVIADYDFGNVDIETKILREAGADVIALQAKSEADLWGAAADCDAIMTQYARVGAETIGRMQKCKVIARYGVGVDIVDVDAASQRGILVTNVRDYCTEEVADHAVSLWLMLARKLDIYNRATHDGVWQWQSGMPVHRIRGRTMGIVSFGKIGRAIFDRVIGFGVNVLVYDPYLTQDDIEDSRVTLVDKETLLRQSDYVVMQAPMTSETRYFLSDAEFAIMKPTSILVNTGRGPTVDNTALYKALVEQRISAAGMDDPEEEPAKRALWSPKDNPLFTLPNVVITPHAAYYSEESIMLARTRAAEQVAMVLTGRAPDYPVNADRLKEYAH